MLQSEKPLKPRPVIRFPRNPPRNAPTIPMSMVTMAPPGSLPGMMAFAIAPAIKPSTIHAMIPIDSPPRGGHNEKGQSNGHTRLGIRGSAFADRQKRIHEDRWAQQSEP